MIEKSNFNTEVTEIEGKITSISGLATKTELTAVENKVPIVSNLVKKSKLLKLKRKLMSINMANTLLLQDLIS